MANVKMNKNFQIYNKKDNKWYDTVVQADDPNNDTLIDRLKKHSEDNNWHYYQTDYFDYMFTTQSLFRKRKHMT